MALQAAPLNQTSPTKHFYKKKICEPGFSFIEFDPGRWTKLDLTHYDPPETRFSNQKDVLPREAAKKLFFLVVGPLRGGGGEGRTTKKKYIFLKLEKKIRKKDDH